MILKFVKKEVGKNKISLLYKNHNKELVQRLPHGGTKWVLDTKCREVEITEQLSIGHSVIVLVGKRKICFLCRREKKRKYVFLCLFAKAHSRIGGLGTHRGSAHGGCELSPVRVIACFGVCRF